MFCSSAQKIRDHLQVLHSSASRFSLSLDPTFIPEFSFVVGPVFPPEPGISGTIVLVEFCEESLMVSCFRSITSSVQPFLLPGFHGYLPKLNPDIVLVHYLNVPSPEDSGKCSPLMCTLSDRHDTLRWSRDDLQSQLKPMCTEPSRTKLLSVTRVFIEELVQHILDRQRTKPQPRTHTCLCSTSQGPEQPGIFAQPFIHVSLPHINPAEVQMQKHQGYPPNICS
ncbi:hypothetical protein XENOCAPTIV_021541 [Xenoophorus captivus]|uniref:Uncharacterized protein n=1 Tax=Xenoophorus captivus TaxID=1517983 RepID=A0ABV0QSY8_9TELE